MRCYYEVLGVAQTADEAAIKKGYRVQALQWHPDKNQHRLEEAGDRFKEISNAYEVLSDKHERAWYDSHREDILRAGSHQSGSWGVSKPQRPDDEEDIFSYFSARCYSGYTDDKTGFYATYDALFEKLVQQEVKAAERRGDAGAKARASGAPRFGQSTATWAQVAAFYDHFLSFATLKDFAWADEHNPAAAPNRKVRRLIEDENNKRRKVLRRHYNETVRELATFVRKRDKRVLAHNAEEAQKRQAREAEVEQQRAADKAARAAAAAQYQEADWIRASKLVSSDEESSEEEALVDYACVVCDKTFRSERALANHERSKKHQEKLAELRELLEEEEQLLDGDAPGSAREADQHAAAPSSYGSAGEGDVASDDEGPDTSAARSRRQQKKEKKRRKQRARMFEGAAVGDSDSAASAASDSDAEQPAFQATAGRQGDADGGTASSSTGGSEAAASELGEDDMLTAMMASHSVRREQAAAKAAEPDADDSSDGAADSADTPADCAAEAEGSGEAADEGGPGSGTQRGAASQNGAALATEPEAAAPKGKRQRAKKGGAKPAAASEPAGPPELQCSVCQREFPSRTKLFSHIQQTGHARLK